VYDGNFNLFENIYSSYNGSNMK